MLDAITDKIVASPVEALSPRAVFFITKSPHERSFKHQNPEDART
jgi:hypothetical protein